MGLAAKKTAKAETVNRFSKLFSSPMHIYEKSFASSHGNKKMTRNFPFSQNVAMAAVRGGTY